MSRLELTSLVPDSVNPEPVLSPHGHLCIGSPSSVYGASQSDSLLLALDSVCLGFSLFLRGSMRLGISTLAYGMSCSDPFPAALDSIGMGPLLSLRNFLRPEPMLSVFGMACLELSLPASDFSVFGSPLPVQSPLRVGLMPLALRSDLTRATAVSVGLCESRIYASFAWVRAHGFGTPSLRNDVPWQLHAAA